MDWAQYAALYPDGPDESGFERLRWEARRVMERATTGVDGVAKLTAAPPTEPHATQTVERCEAALVRLLWRMERGEDYVNRQDGTVTGRVVTAVTAGSESVTYAPPAADTAGRESREALLRQTAAAYLAGTADANGVNLTYMGRYPAALA